MTKEYLPQPYVNTYTQVPIRKQQTYYYGGLLRTIRTRNDSGIVIGGVPSESRAPGLAQHTDMDEVFLTCWI